jgi:hypothetical protein
MHLGRGNTHLKTKWFRRIKNKKLTPLNKLFERTITAFHQVEKRVNT